MRVLIVEDYEPIRESLRQGLREAGFVVDAAADGKHGRCFVELNDYDVVVLDLMLPGVDGLSILDAIRARGGDTRVLILSAKDQLEDRIAGFDRGADDYLVKPFAFAELLARVRALVRRRYEIHDPLLRIADLEINTGERTVKRGPNRIELTAREYALLEYLAARAGQVVSRADIWEHVYDQPGSRSNVVDVYIGYLRKKIEIPGLPKLLHTRRGHGYQLQAS